MTQLLATRSQPGPRTTPIRFLAHYATSLAPSGGNTSGMSKLSKGGQKTASDGIQYDETASSNNTGSIDAKLSKSVIEVSTVQHDDEANHRLVPESIDNSGESLH